MTYSNQTNGIQNPTFPHTQSLQNPVSEYGQLVVKSTPLAIQSPFMNNFHLQNATTQAEKLFTTKRYLCCHN